MVKLIYILSSLYLMKIDGFEIKAEREACLISDIKAKKYQVDVALVKRHLRRVLHGNRKALEKLSSAHFDSRSRKSAWYKDIVKSVRFGLRKSVGIFEINVIHLSMEEREPHYRPIYEKIFAITGRPKKIIDIACGTNPLSYPQMGLGRVEYIAWDVSEPCIKLVREFFSKNKIKGRAQVADVLSLRKQDLFAHVPMQDVCFLFKALDSLEPTKGHTFAELIITKVPARYVVASFSTKTITGKPMRHPYRGWMDRMLERLKYDFHIFVQGDEIFYVIKK